MRVIFLGTPDFAKPVLRAIVRSRHEVIAAISQPDRARNRKGELLHTPVKCCAEELCVPCYSFERLKDHADELRALKPDVMVTAAYGQILTQEILDIPPYGVINVHASLLPKYRGSSPIQWAVVNGEKETGVTIMRTERGLDTGDILRVRRTAIGERETAGELFGRLCDMGAEAAVEELDALENGTSVRTPQNEAEATYCGKLTKADGELDFARSAEELFNLVRGLNPWPVAYTLWNGETLKVYESTVVGLTGAPGTVAAADGLTVYCGRDALRFDRVQLPGKRVMTAAEFLAGHTVAAGAVLGR